MPLPPHSSEIRDQAPPVLEPSAEQLEESKGETKPPKALVSIHGSEPRVTVREAPDITYGDNAGGALIELVAVCGRFLHQVVFSHHNVPALLQQELIRPVAVSSGVLDVAVSIARDVMMGGLLLLLCRVAVAQDMGHVVGDEPSILAAGEGALLELVEGEPLHEGGGAEDPEDAIHNPPTGAVDVDEDETPEPDHAAGALEGAGEALHPDGVQLLAEELNQEHPHKDDPGLQRQVRLLMSGGTTRLAVLGFGEEVGHDREEQGERRGEDEADVGVQDGADIRDAAEKVEVEEHPGEEEHEDGAGHHGDLIALVDVRGGEVVYEV